jgi:3-hydroxy-5-methyl-1-naphthoate 3-O-methyltransferase
MIMNKEQQTIEQGISPDPIFQMLTGFWVSKTLMTAVELEVFTKLDGKSVNMQRLQEILEMESRPAEVFSVALVSLGLLSKDKRKKVGELTNGQNDYHYTNTDLTNTFLVKGKTGYMGDIISMFDKRLYKSWDKLSYSLKANKPIAQEEGGDAESLFNQAKSSNQAVEQIQKFTHGIYGISVGPAIALAKAFDFSKYKRMMDIGGGSGVYAIQVAKRYPNMSATVLDLKPVCDVADGYIELFDFKNRIQTKSVDFFNEDLPTDCDVTFLSHIIHDYGKDKDRSSIEKIYSTLPSGDIGGGAIIISEWLLNDEKTGPLSSALMGLNMMVETSGGRNYSYSEVSEMLTGVGFKNIEKRPLAGPAEIVIGYK